MQPTVNTQSESGGGGERKGDNNNFGFEDKIKGINIVI